MPANILATGSTPADSPDLVVTTPITVGLKEVPVGNVPAVTISLKDDASKYNPVGYLSASEPATVISGPGTYRFSRTSGTCGVFSA